MNNSASLMVYMLLGMVALLITGWYVLVFLTYITLHYVQLEDVKVPDH